MVGNTDDIDKAIADLQEDVIRLRAQASVLQIVVVFIVNALSKTDPDAPRRIVEELSNNWLPGMISEADPSVDPLDPFIVASHLALEQIRDCLAKAFNIN